MLVPEASVVPQGDTGKSGQTPFVMKIFAPLTTYSCRGSMSSVDTTRSRGTLVLALFIRRARSAATFATLATTASIGLISMSPSAAAATGHPPGIVGSPIKLATAQFSGYDVAANPSGTAYIGWISSTESQPARTVHLCKLPVGATSCAGGVQTISSLGDSSAAGLRVLVTGDDVVHLLWFHDTPNSINGPLNGAIAEATALHGQNLTTAHDVVTDAPSFGQLLDVGLGPAHSIWAVAYAGTPAQQVQVWPGLSASRTAVTTPYPVGYAQLAFASGKPVLAVEKYGSISTAAHYATRSSGGTWSPFRAVAHTWAAGTDAALETTKHGMRIVTAVNHASHHPVIAKWTGSGFAPRHLTADHSSCAPSTHDGWADARGRLLDVSWECNKVAVANYADAFHAAIVRFKVTRSPTFAPQIASGTRRIATVAYTVQTGAGDVLRVAHVRLPVAA